MNKPFMWNWQWRFLNVYSYTHSEQDGYWHRRFGFRVCVNGRDFGFGVKWGRRVPVFA